MSRPKVLGRLLMERGAVTAPALEEALEQQRRLGRRIGTVLVARGATSEEEVCRALALQLGLPRAPSPLAPSAPALELVGGQVARAAGVLPLSLDPKRVQVAMADPLNLEAVEDLRFMTGRRIDVLVTTPSELERALASAYGEDLAHLVAALPRTAETEADADLSEAVRSAPVVRLVDRVLHEAVARTASDIHVEETGSDVRVRFRVDGVLQRRVELPAAVRRAVLSRIKVMAGMDISVRRRAQDGGMRLEHDGRALTLRISTLPVNGGEKAVVRVLDPSAVPQGLGALGLSPTDLGRLRRLLAAREGVILATGPTGSGKSSTLFAALSELDRDRLNVVTLEDPVEYRLPGVNQIQIDPRAGLGFAQALRAVLRQDPDVVMVGEIRDRETAEIAMSAAVTGHLVLSTLHTTDAPGAVARLLNMGVPPYLVAGGLAGVVAQRLVRTVCRPCRGAGCGRCDDGLRGRTGIFQLLVVSARLREEIARGAGASGLRATAALSGMGSLAEDARRVLAEGRTGPHEIARILAADPDAAPPCGACGGVVSADAEACPHCGRRRVHRCPCGVRLQRRWRFCPACVRRVAA